jgi:small subunit ribosomal protein S21
MSYRDKTTQVARKGNHVVVGPDGNVERALRKFKKKVMDSGLLRELKDREFYEKPTTERKRKKSAAKNRWQKQIRKDALPKKLY